MSKTVMKVWKYSFSPGDEPKATLDIPAGAQLLDLLEVSEAGTVSFWASHIVGSEDAKEPRTVQFVGTGHALMYDTDSQMAVHVASCIDKRGYYTFVWHLFEIIGEA